MAQPVLSLPRYIALKPGPQDGHDLYLALAPLNGVPYLTFTAQQKTRFATHEVVYNTDVSGVVMIRAPNRRFWRRNDAGYIVADREEIPDPSIAQDRACYFRVTGQASNMIVLQSLVDDLYLKRYTHTIRDGYCAITRTIDPWTTMQFTAADDTAITLPRYIMLFGDNKMYVGDHRERNIDWLKFNKPDERLSAAHEVIPLVDGNVMIRNININKFWRRSPNWIWADADASDALRKIDCHFDVIKLSSTLVAFKSKANNLFLKRYSDYWQDCLCAIGNNINDSTTRLVLSEALLSRRLFNIRYLLELAEVSNITPIIVGSGSMRNDTNLTTSMEVLVSITRTVSTSETWSISNTFSSSLTVGFSVGVPEVASVNGSVTIGHERTISTEMGKTAEEAVQFQTTYKVDDVPPRMEVKVTVECTTAKCRVPFTYSSSDTRVDGVDLPAVNNNVDGIFEGVSAFNIRGVVSEVGRSTPIQILPVSVVRTPLHGAT
ncbi:hypothetical protein O6H91_07G022300 [Diphasiastrum complanatum]|uniref:Uncharacterized protein n=1 Tax=Diphasiastrum complanatum TaxID=34168 RepID=A0ACC2D315_DIPCM|nr:hypothetical protein O6H91_Y305700 [Diphasiastrum complanatum]KAJ7289049.1 hypothetical protein O6H91_Y305700 [Diphasiastrum complanatum]KAJ7289050.1 hypothetical protein O6H91_Y305700 [Diphasiastrum complanatum]KAJ7289051.1 hypothetical protein O6H91_Y305700 [Diphasiastrum complanatum]KAJ7289052.1 hypothetical protein O6H91_Y305700 [Diphasiastrum complanatum]